MRAITLGFACNHHHKSCTFDTDSVCTALAVCWAWQFNSFLKPITNRFPVVASRPRANGRHKTWPERARAPTNKTRSENSLCIYMLWLHGASRYCETQTPNIQTCVLHRCRWRLRPKRMHGWVLMKFDWSPRSCSEKKHHVMLSIWFGGRWASASKRS